MCGIRNKKKIVKGNEKTNENEIKKEVTNEEPEKEEIKEGKPVKKENENEEPPKVEKNWNEDNLQKAKEFFKDVNNFGQFTKSNDLKVAAAEQVSIALNAIKDIGKATGYQNTSKSRKTFLDAVAKYLGLNEEILGSLQKNVYNGDNKLQGKYTDNPAAEFLMHLRNLIAYGLGYGTGDAMPDLDLFGSFETKITNLKDSWSKLENILEQVKQGSTNQALNVINGFELQYNNKKSASKNFTDFQNAIETKCKNNKIYLVLFGKLFENLKLICEAIDNKMGNK